MQTKQQQFYKSKKWEAFRKVIIAERTTEDGYVHCARCGKAILKPYDLIIHHLQELSDDNVADALVALNPDKVECVCFRCHNQIHDRFVEGHTNVYSAVRKKVFIVYGSPFSGKVDWVKSVATENDIVVDLDNIWQMISINDRNTKPAVLKSVVFEIRDKMYDIIKYRSGKWHNAYVIIGGALKGDRERLVQRIGADDTVYIDTSLEECQKKILNSDLPDEGKLDMLLYINDWFEKFQADDVVD